MSPSVLFSQSQWNIWGVMLRSGEREREREREGEGEEGLLTGGGTSCSPPPPTAAADERARAAHAMLLRRGLSPLRQNPVYLPDNLICPTQPELKMRCTGYYYYDYYYCCMYFGYCGSEVLRARRRSCRWRSFKNIADDSSLNKSTALLSVRGYNCNPNPKYPEIKTAAIHSAELQLYYI